MPDNSEEQDLKQLFDSVDIPAPNEERRKETLNLAQAEFEKNAKSFQGKGFFSRLTSRQPNKRRESMSFSEKKVIYGGLATACIALMIYTSVSITQDLISTGHGPISAAQVNKIQFDTSRELSPEMKQVIENVNPQNTDYAVAQSAVPPLERWREMKAEAPTAAKRAPQTESLALANMATPASPPVAVMGRAAGFAGNEIGIASMPMPYPQAEVGRDKFKDFEQNSIHQVKTDPVSTFSIDVDTASYSFVRHNLDNGVLPQNDAIRVEEMVNYFDYAYPAPSDKAEPFKSTLIVTDSPWHQGRKLVTIGIKGYEEKLQAPDSNLVFLVDTSGSMSQPNKLPLLKQSLTMLLDQLKPTDKVSIVAYAGSAGTILPPTEASKKGEILMALQNMQASGSTAGAEGINLAYQLAEANFNKDAVNRVILATDGDFNVGITNPEELKSFIERKRDGGVFLSVLGFGSGNYNDALMQDLAQNGNGVAAYIDNLNEARKVLVQEAGAMLFPIAKDVKIQVEFNPQTVAEYRLVGYETRALKTEDFNNDKVDAGDIGSGHTVTAIYEITPVGAEKAIDDSRYEPKVATENSTAEYGFLKIRYKLPKESTSKLITTPISMSQPDVSPELKSETDFAVAVAGFGQLLKGGKYTGSLTYDDIIKTAQANKGADPYGYRTEFLNLVYKAKTAAAMQPGGGQGYPQHYPQ